MKPRREACIEHLSAIFCADHLRAGEREFLVDNLLVRILFFILMIRWTGLAPWEFEFPFPDHLWAGEVDYRGTSLIRNRPPLGTYSSICLGPHGAPSGGGLFLMSEVPLWWRVLRRRKRHSSRPFFLLPSYTS